ncbi:MAG TPA: hypothetical protein VGW38_24160, partial [Chloroflexota bacterium]|nr:hypothetical protein [Chloroflexota bacterium]
LCSLRAHRWESMRDEDTGRADRPRGLQCGPPREPSVKQLIEPNVIQVTILLGYRATSPTREQGQTFSPDASHLQRRAAPTLPSPAPPPVPEKPAPLGKVNE